MTVSQEIASAIEGRLREMARSGMTRHEAAEATGWGYPAIHRYANRFDIEFAKKYRLSPSEKFRIDSRADDFERRYRNGETLAAIGSDFGLTRERVRQVLALKKGIDGSDGGQFVKASRKKAEVDSRREKSARARWGCSLAEYKGLIALGQMMMAEGLCRERTPVGAYRRQKANASVRSIGWSLTLWQWWTIWQQSGRWDDRGRGHGYVMCRKGDQGPYAAENVVIAPGHANASMQARKVSGLPTGVSIQKGRYVASIGISGKRTYLGVFPTPELAHDAYLTAVAKVMGHNRVEAA